MSPRQELFQRLHDVREIKALIGTSEHLHLECKTWSTNDNESQKGVAKAWCGFANADGGVLVIGLSTKTNPDKYTPDVIDAAVPVADALALRSRVESLVPDLVEPPMAGVTVAAVAENAVSKAGFVIVDIPPTDGPPCRSRKDWRMYQRINSGTYLMEYFQIESMFGKRRRPVLALHLEVGEPWLEGQRPELYERPLIIGIENSGRAVARFPSIRFKAVPGININRWGIDGNLGFGLPRRATEPELIVFGGGADHVIYPGTILKIARLDQRAKRSEWQPVGSESREKFYFEGFNFTAEIAADEVPSQTEHKTVPSREIP